MQEFGNLCPGGHTGRIERKKEMDKTGWWAQGSSVGDFRTGTGIARTLHLFGVIRKQLFPSAIPMKSGKSQERFIAFQTPELPRQLEPTLIL